MCLYYDEKATRKFREKCKRGGKTFVKFYKVVHYDYYGKGEIRSIVYNHRWSGGWNYANKIPVKIKTLIIDSNIHEGIHVYTTRKEAREHTYGCRRILPAKCYIKDLIGKDSEYKKRAVFTKVWVDKKELDKIRKKKCA